MTPEQSQILLQHMTTLQDSLDNVVRLQQFSNAVVMGLLIGLSAVLFFGIIAAVRRG